MPSPNDQMVLHEGLNDAITGFAHTLMATPEWRAMLEAQRAFEHDEELTRLLSRYSVLARRQQRQEPSARLTEEEHRELVALETQIQQHPLFLRREASLQTMQTLCYETNQVLCGILGIDFAATAAPRRGGCCG